MKIIEKKDNAFNAHDVELGDVLIHSRGAKYIVVGTQFNVRCLRLDDKLDKQPFSLTDAYNNIPHMINDLFGCFADELKLVKDAEIHI